MLGGPGGHGAEPQRADATRFSAAADDLLHQLDAKLARCPS